MLIQLLSAAPPSSCGVLLQFSAFADGCQHDAQEFLLYVVLSFILGFYLFVHLFTPLAVSLSSSLHSELSLDDVLQAQEHVVDVCQNCKTATSAQQNSMRTAALPARALVSFSLLPKKKKEQAKAQLTNIANKQRNNPRPFFYSCRR